MLFMIFQTDFVEIKNNFKGSAFYWQKRINFDKSMK